jgi:hypothetical protein
VHTRPAKVAGYTPMDSSFVGSNSRPGFDRGMDLKQLTCRFLAGALKESGWRTEREARACATDEGSKHSGHGTKRRWMKRFMPTARGKESSGEK